MTTPEEAARATIDARLAAAGWIAQGYKQVNLGAGLGVAIREFPLKTGFADYLLFADRQAVGVVEAEPAGMTLSGIAPQSGQCTEGLPATLPAWCRPLPFHYESTGVETLFTSGLDPEPRSRRLFSFHQPRTLLACAQEEQSLRARLRELPPLAEQCRIVAEVVRRLSVVDELEAIVDASLARAERLRQAILKAAFAGWLVPQDPNDEPTRALLAKMKANRVVDTRPRQQRLFKKDQPDP